MAATWGSDLIGRRPIEDWQLGGGEGWGCTGDRYTGLPRYLGQGGELAGRVLVDGACPLQNFQTQ